MIDILPCPLCEGTPKLETAEEAYGHGSFGQKARVRCSYCRISTDWCDDYRDDKFYDTAIQLWNNLSRTSDPDVYDERKE